jgi:hypothetical protein
VTSPDDAGFVHPRNESELRDLILEARQTGAKLRVRGSGHTTPVEAIRAPEPEGVNVMLDALRRIDLPGDVVRVQAGRHLSEDPNHPVREMPVREGLLFAMERRGCALSDLGGITHQTVGGFLSTGSSGGSTRESPYDQIEAISFIDGNGELHEVSRELDADLFFAVGVSMGLLGVVTSVTFRPIPRYDVIGVSRTEDVDEAHVQLFSAGPDGLRNHLENTEYARILWWPQQGLERVDLWEARRMEETDYNDKNSPRGEFKPNPYDMFRGPIPDEIQQRLGGGLMKKLSRDYADPSKHGSLARSMPNLLGFFVDKKGPKDFWDVWWKGLPMDNQVHDELLPTEFTEFWIDIRQTEAVMDRLREHYARGVSATGPYACEIYAGAESDFWLSPGYGRTSIRIDLFWYSDPEVHPESIFYPQFWDLLSDFDFRLHWGKHLPDRTTPSSDPDRDWPGYMRSQYPRIDDFMRLRADLDPRGVFLTDYWSSKLGI